MISGILWRIRRIWQSAWLATGVHRRRTLSALAGAFDPSMPSMPSMPSNERGHVILCAPGGGNIGDQAMFEAFAEGVDGKVTAIARGADDIRVVPSLAERVTVVALPDLVYGTGQGQRAAYAVFASLLRDARSFSVVGADIMDGHYNERASVTRAVLAEFAAGAGIDTRVLGFSWNGHPRRAARRALARAGAAGVRLLARDPRSAQRLRADGVSGVSDVADIVFAATTIDRTESGFAQTERPFVLVNASALVARQLDLVEEYAQFVREILDRADVVLVPHVSRPGDDDIAVCRRVRDLVADSRVSLVERLLTPAGIRGLVQGAALVVTGRMHLSIIALSQEVPAIVFSTQGKVDGLADLLASPDLCVTPAKGVAGLISERALRELGSAEGPLRAAVRMQLPHVLQLARRNTDGLGRPQ